MELIGARLCAAPGIRCTGLDVMGDQKNNDSPCGESFLFLTCLTLSRDGKAP